jgi:hypothetical protein
MPPGGGAAAKAADLAEEAQQRKAFGSRGRAE